MKARGNLRLRRAYLVGLGLLLLAAADLLSQTAAPTLTVLSREGRRAMPLVITAGQEMVALDELATIFQLAVREEAGALTVSYRGKTIVLTPEQSLASVNGRLISLPAQPVRVGNRWLVPVDFISRALALIHDAKIDLHRPSRLLVIGELNVPRLTVRHEPLGNAARVTIDATPAATSAVSQDGSRLVIRYEADALDLTFPQLQPQPFVQGFRTLDPVTIGVDLGPRFTTFRATTQVIDTTSRLVIDLTGAQESTTSGASSQTPPAVPELPISAAEAPTVRTLAIDPGHGGEDGGAKGEAGLQEKHVTLAVARRLKAAVEARLGLRVVLTRDEDRNVSLNERTAVANNNKADLLISLHVNASFRESVAGASIFVASFDEVGDVQGALSGERLPALGGGFRDIELVPWNLAQIRYRDRSERMAGILAQYLRDRVPLSIRPLDRAPLRVLESANMPAVLIEMGYVTNRVQEKQIAGAEFQNALVQSVVDSIVRFRDSLSGPEGGER